jgi:anti-sigma factor RsiW
VTCQDLVAFMLDYVDETLPPDVRARFDAHLAECEDCQAYLKDYRVTIDLTREAAAHEDPPSMPDALVRAIVDSAKNG